MSFNLNLEEADMNVILEALGSMPFNKVVNTINKIMMQVRAQQTPPAAPLPATQEPAPNA